MGKAGNTRDGGSIDSALGNVARIGNSVMDETAPDARGRNEFITS